MSAKIADVAYFLPKSHNLKNLLQPNHFKKIYTSTGIKKIHIASKKQSALDLAKKAANAVLKKNRSKIDAIIYVTQSPEYFLPSSACILQDQLGISKSALAFDLNQGCSGYIYGLCLASSLIKTNVAKNVLLICSDTYSKYISKKNSTCLPIFSDGASATILKKSNSIFFLDFKFGTDGSGYKDLIVENSGFHANSTKPELFMNGKKILMFTMANIPTLINSLLKKNNLKKNEIDLFIFHQASKVVINNLIRKMKLDKNKVYFNIKNIGNTVSSTIPISISDLLQNKKIKKNTKILLAGFGVGLSMGATIINW
tara:strand:+ start:1071 stop:2009 length:939 start_codon:yes stop_codon:yes gene_type:complete